jgi:hypothetical protein
LVSANQRALLYFPDKTRVDPATLSFARISEEVITTPDGAKLICWYLAAEPGKPTLLYFHGNGDRLIGLAERFALYSRAGIGVFVMSYRGYSGSTGTPTEANIIPDSELAWNAVAAKGIDPKDIVLYGHSLGSGVAVQLATHHPARALVLEAPYSSISDVASWRFPFLPVKQLIKDDYNSMSFIGAVHMPLLVIHGEKDGIVPIRFGRKLFAAANEPKRFIAYPQAGHMDCYRFGAFEAVVDFMESVGKSA